jgi:hypothetical protein
MTTADNNAVCAALERTQNKHGVYTAGTRNSDNFYISGIRQTVIAGKVRTGIRTPVATKRND